jgi:hypothetical protein
MELLDDLCEDMDGYQLASTLESHTETPKQWKWLSKKKVNTQEHSKLPSALDADMSKRLKLFCYSVIEQEEETLTAYITRDTKQHEGAN